MKKEMNNKYLKQFDEIFGTETVKRVDINKMPMLYTIYKTFGESLYTQDEEYRALRHDKLDAEKKFVESLTDEQAKLYDYICNVENKKSAVIEKQLFAFGFILAEELKKEMKS